MTRLATEESRTPFDLTRGPLIRVRLLREGPATWVLLLTLHHIIADGWSMRLFFEELRTLYDALAAGRPSLLPPEKHARSGRDGSAGEVADF